MPRLRILLALTLSVVGCEAPPTPPPVQVSPTSEPISKATLRERFATHQALDYLMARRHLFSTIDNHDGKVTGVYTGFEVATTKIPDPAVMNTEHTWPRSRMEGVAETDLHNLFPTKADVNRRRSNIYFGDVLQVEWEEGGSKLGKNKNGKTAFEVRPAHRGNAARAMFYISTVYDLSIPPWEEEFLRTWHEQDPVDTAERERNARVEAVQGNRNPFVDDPTLVARIANF